MVNFCMNNFYLVVLFWGSELIMLYNEVYVIEVVGNKYFFLMGIGFSGFFFEFWDYFCFIFVECV